MATAVINGVVVVGSTNEIYELIQKATTQVTISDTSQPILGKKRQSIRKGV